MSGEDHLRKRSNAGDTCCRASPRVASGSEREAAATQQEAERKCYLEVKSCCENQQELIQEINLSPGTTPWEECRRGQGDKPIVFRGNASSWKSAKWTPESMAGNDSFRGFIVTALLYHRDIQPMSEADCISISTNLQDFARWMLPTQRLLSKANNHVHTCPPAFSKETEKTIPGGNKADSLMHLNMSSPIFQPPKQLEDFDPLNFIGYVSYQYVGNVFSSCPEMMETSFSWDKLGIPEQHIDLHNSAFWFGTEGASTPCHFDTYGCNIAVQLYGRKRWTLFPPSETNNLYPNRLPFEESTVRSSVNIQAPDLHAFPKFANASHLTVDLFPGDVLYVPHGWWHHVCCCTAALSTNLWLRSVHDDVAHVKEAVSQWIVTCCSNGKMDWFCPTQLTFKMVKPLVSRQEAEQQLRTVLENQGIIPPADISRTLTEAFLRPSGRLSLAFHYFIDKF